MKLSLFLITVAVLAGTTLPAPAVVSSVTPVNITISGTISMPDDPTADISGTKVLRITKASLLKVVGLTWVQASETKFFLR